MASQSPAATNHGDPMIHCEIIQVLEDTWSANIFVICMDRPGAEHNIIDHEFGEELARVVFLLWERVRRGEVDLVVLCSGKERSFMAGADVEFELKLRAFGEGRIYEQVLMIQNLLCSFESLPVPTVAIVNGTALGGGLELALACDYRIADSASGGQIGLPEVKLGVLAAAGGCVRLPRLVGFRQALPLLVTGQALTSQQALKSGIVDHLLPLSQTVLKTRGPAGGGGGAVYDYQWLSGLLACMERQKIGARSFAVQRRESGATAVSAVVDAGKECADVGIDHMMSVIAESWEDCERKAEVKYPRKVGFVRSMFELALNALFVTITLFQLWLKVGTRMPAPYVTLETTLRGFYAGTWKRAMSESAHGMTRLLTSAESAGLMSLFVLTRRLRKLAVRFGLKSAEKVPPFKQLGFTVCVYASTDLYDLSLPFIQGLLYSGIPVNIIITDKAGKESLIVKKIRGLFDYALKRRYISKKELEEKMGLLTVCGCAGVGERVEGWAGEGVIVMNASTVEFSVMEISKHFSEVIHATLSPEAVSLTTPYQILLNLGDPVRKSTLTVELTPLSDQTPAKHIRALSSLVAALGKTPVLTPPTPHTSHGLHMLQSHWSLAVSLVSVFGGNLSPSRLDKVLLSAGYSDGPFQMMKKFGKLYPAQQHNRSTHLARLQKYLKTGQIPATERKKHLSLSDKQLADLFTLNLALTALHLRQTTPGLSEAALDTLSVTGLIRFPPTEGGPLSFAARIGQEALLRIYDDCVGKVPFVADVCGARKPRELISGRMYLDLFNTEDFSGDTNSDSVVDVLKGQRSGTVLLGRSDLRKVGVAKGLQSRELLLYPFLLSSVLLRAGLALLVLIVLLIVFCPF